MTGTSWAQPPQSPEAEITIDNWDLRPTPGDLFRYYYPDTKFTVPYSGKGTLKAVGYNYVGEQSLIVLKEAATPGTFTIVAEAPVEDYFVHLGDTDSTDFKYSTRTVDLSDGGYYVRYEIKAYIADNDGYIVLGDTRGDVAKSNHFTVEGITISEPVEGGTGGPRGGH